MLTQELLAEAAVIATQALSAGPAFHSRSAAVALVVRRQHLTTSHSVLCWGGPAAKLDAEHSCWRPIKSETCCTT